MILKKRKKKQKTRSIELCYKKEQTGLRKGKFKVTERTTNY